MAKDIQVFANDLRVYFKGFETALGSGNVEDAIRYLRDMRAELNDNLEYLITRKEGTAIEEVMKTNIQESIEDYKKRIKNLEKELER